MRWSSRRRARAAWLALGAIAAAPAFAPGVLPCQDLPQHLAALRVLTSLHDPAYGFDVDYTSNLGSGTYLFPYLVGVALARFVGVMMAGRLLLAGYLAGTVLGVRALARALGRDGRVALLSLPLVLGPCFYLGLLPYLVSMALLVWALAASAAHARAPSPLRAGALGALGIALALTHPQPVAALLVGHVAFVTRWGAGRRAATLAPLLPAAALFAYYLGWTESGVVARLVGDATAAAAQADPIGRRLRELPEWLGGALCDGADRRMLLVTALVAAVGALASRRPYAPGRRATAAAIALVPALCALAYLRAPMGQGYSWPIAPRFALMAGLTALPLVRLPVGRLGGWLTTVAGCAAAGTLAVALAHERSFQDEARGLAEALAAIPRGRHVAYLPYEATSRVVRFAPFVHSGAYYQVASGGVVKFSFAGYDHWPVDFRPDRYPPPGAPAMPDWASRVHRVSVSRELAPYFDYVLARGAGFAPPATSYARSSTTGPWEVWKRIDREAPSPSRYPGLVAP